VREKLLVLDDESLILGSLQHLFEDDYEVFATSNAGHALELAAQHEMGVILCDERMPNVSGHEFLRQVSKISSATRVMMSGYADMSALTEAVNDGQIFAYIAKPWEPHGLKVQVRSAMVHFNLLREVDQERALVHALMEGIPDLIYFKDCELRFTRVNRAHARTLGAEDATKCVGQRDSDYFGSEDSPLEAAGGRNSEFGPGPGRLNRAYQKPVGNNLLDVDNQNSLVRPERAGFRDRRRLEGYYSTEEQRGNALATKQTQPHDHRNSQ